MMAKHKGMGEYERLSKAIAGAIEEPTAEFRARKRKTDAAWMLWEAQVSGAIRELLRKEAARARKACQEEVAKEREQIAFYQERISFYREWLDESREFNRRLMDTLDSLRQKAGRGGGLSAQDWDELKGMTDAELRRWVTIGARMEANPTTYNPAEQAKRWVVENRPALTE